MKVDINYIPSGARALWRNELELRTPLFGLQVRRRAWKWWVGGEEYPHQFDKPWQVEPDDPRINDLPDDKVFDEVPF